MTLSRGFVPLIIGNLTREFLEARRIAYITRKKTDGQQEASPLVASQKYQDGPGLGYSAFIIFSNIITHPFEVLRVQLTLNFAKWKDEKHIGMYKAGQNVLKTEGISGLYRGFIPFTVFSIFYRNLVYDHPERNQERNPDTEAKIFLCDLTFYPLIVIGTRMMAAQSEPGIAISANFKTIKSCCQNTLKEFGFAGFYKGFWVTLLLYGVDILDILYDRAKRKYQEKSSST